MAAHTHNFDEAKRLVLGILQASGGSYNGSVRLNKVFYDAHLFYWQHYGQYLSSHQIARMPNGPAIDGWQLILQQLVRDGELVINRRPVGPYAEDLFVAKGEPKPPLLQEELSAIESALSWVGDKSASEISHESHLRSRTWREGANGEHLHVILDTLSDVEMAGKQRALDAVKF